MYALSESRPARAQGAQRDHRAQRTPRRFSSAEETAHSLTHALGAVLGLPATAFLVRAALRGGDALDAAGAAVFGISLVLLFSASAIYHALTAPRAKGLMRIADHDAIYVLIAGTYTPFCLTVLRDGSGLAVLGLVWALAGVGIAVGTAFPGRFRLASLACYLAMGWIVAFFLPELGAAAAPGVVALLLAGGIAYSVGAIVYAFESVPWLHTLWHVFVLAGAGFHVASVATAYAALAR